MKNNTSNVGGNHGDSEESEMEFTRNVAFLMKEYSMNYFEIMQLPFAMLLSLLKWARIFQIEQTEKGRDALYKESAIHQTEPDLGRLRNLTGYKAKKGNED